MKYSESLKKHKDFQHVYKKEVLMRTSILSCMYWRIRRKVIDWEYL